MVQPDAPLRCTIITTRVVGLRFGEGILASPARLAGSLVLERVVGLAAGHGQALSDFADVAAWARTFGVAYVGLGDPSEVQKEIRAEEGHATIVVGWPHRIPLGDYAVPSNRLLGIHPRRLPFGRGRSPIPWGIEEGETPGVLSIFQLTTVLDGGPIIGEFEWELGPFDDSTSSYLKACNAHFLAGQGVGEILMEESVARDQKEVDVAAWPHRSGQRLLISRDMTRAEVKARVRAQAPPFPAAVVEIDGDFIKVDSRLSQFAWAEPTNEALLIRFADGLLPLVLAG